MVIKFEQTNNKYYIKDLEDGMGTFLKITKPLLLQEGYLILYGDNYMVISAGKDQSISVEFLEGSKVG